MFQYIYNLVEVDEMDLPHTLRKKVVREAWVCSGRDSCSNVITPDFRDINISFYKAYNLHDTKLKSVYITSDDPIDL